MSPTTIFVLLFCLLCHPVSPQRPKDERIDRVWKKLHALSKKAKNQMQSDPTGRPMFDQPYGGILNTPVGNKPRTSDKIRDLLQVRNPVPVTFAPSGTGCNFEEQCQWQWKNKTDGFRIGTPSNVTGPLEDADGNKKGHFLMLRVQSGTNEQLHVTSPLFYPGRDTCKAQVWIYQENMSGGEVKIVVEIVNHTQWVADIIEGDDSRKWIKHEKVIGKMTQNYNIILDVLPPANKSSMIAIDNVKLTNCFPERHSSNFCTPYQFKCSISNVCINNTRVCDITRDCQFGDDETQNCEHMPPGARCDFEHDWCGWYNVSGNGLEWARHNGSTPTNGTGPDVDHTFRNNTGIYAYVNMAKGDMFGNSVTLKSQIFNPPPRVHGNASSPYYNSCMVRFYLHQTGAHKSGLMLQVTELRPTDNLTTNILWSYANHGNFWTRQVVVLPNITNKYFLHFDARKGARFMSDIAIDDVSLSPECFGLNIPETELDGYNYWNPIEEPVKEVHKDFMNQTVHTITTCGSKGRFGPSQSDCDNEYNDTEVAVLTATGLNGVQKWKAPNEGFYTFFLFGASGGKGSGGMGSSRGAMVRMVIELRKGQEFFILVGQEGSNACLKSLARTTIKSTCIPSSKQLQEKGVRGVLNMQLGDGGGGGGGGTFIFYRNRTDYQLYPLAVAAGGGGIGLGHFVDTGVQHGHGFNVSRPPVTGQMYGIKRAGAGGGWKMFHNTLLTDEQRLMMGQPLTNGGMGGKACYNSTDYRGDGGFGGGGGGCTWGGGGGGYAGGSVLSNSTNGEGGYSYVDTTRTLTGYAKSYSGYNRAGPGYVLIVPAVPGCDCDYRCIALDESRSEVACICPMNWKLDIDRKTCKPKTIPETYPPWFVIGLIATVMCLLMAFSVICFMLCKYDNRYQQRVTGLLGQKVLSGPDLQLNRLRVASDSMTTEYNPSYEFGGGVYTLKDLKDIPRDQLRLVKALGQGAFGEVYQGFYRQRSGDTVEMPVAVKTLPEMSTGQAEMDFLMEALIMSKFNHPNIVHFIGVCFDKHPRFIVLELLAGGDLKNFLRESRPKPERYTTLTMKDLVLIAVDVAKGCRYLEENRFIHRDIAARNCLLTTKGPGRVAKIADFGMSRDVYRAEYYRKDGKAMLPIKWMPPEAFLDGIFTSKTDVWSFGVLLWEIMSMGYMPYTGCANREVMQLVTSGGRLEPPANCPGPIYGIMTQCWHPAPEERPNFATLLERLDYCLQDPNVMSVNLPVFSRPPSHERDPTVMRPKNTEDNCLEVPQATDYLVPNHHTHFSVMPNSMGVTSSVEKLLPENSDSWETSFVVPNSGSTQPLLQDSEQQPAEAVDQLVTQNTQKVTNIPPPNTVVSNHNNNVKNESALKSGVSLDAGALVKQMQKKPYVNVGTTGENGVLVNNGPYAAQNQNSNKFIGNPEISC